VSIASWSAESLWNVDLKKWLHCVEIGRLSDAMPILIVFPALIVHSELKSVHPGFPVALFYFQSPTAEVFLKIAEGRGGEGGERRGRKGKRGERRTPKNCAPRKRHKNGQNGVRTMNE